MLRKVVLLLVVVSMLAIAVGCTTYNTANFSRTAHLRRLAITGEQLRMAHEDIDRILLLEHYPISGKYNH